MYAIFGGRLSDEEAATRIAKNLNTIGVHKITGITYGLEIPTEKMPTIREINKELKTGVCHNLLKEETNLSSS